MNLPIPIERPDRNRPEPLWHQTERALRAMIADGAWRDGAQIPNEAKLSEMLIREGSAAVYLRRLRFGAGQPIGIQTAYPPARRVPGLLEMSEPILSLYATLRDRFGLVPQAALEVYRVGAVSGEDAELLDGASDSPAFIVERTTSDARGPFEFTVSTMRGDRYEIRSKLHM